MFEAALGRDSTEAAHTIYREELRIFSTSINQSPCRSMDLNMKPPSSLILKKISKQPLAGVLAHPSQKSRIRQAVRNGLAAILPRSVYLTQGPKVSHSLCLTFDDGPDPEITPRLLDLLGNFQIPATFFPIGRCAEKYPSIIRRMATEGHSIGSHTYSHEITKPKGDLLLDSRSGLRDGGLNVLAGDVVVAHDCLARFRLGQVGQDDADHHPRTLNTWPAVAPGQSQRRFASRLRR